MIERKSEREKQYMIEAGQLLASIHKRLAEMIEPGVTTLELDQFVENTLNGYQAKAVQKGYHGYPFATCASVNDEICHGFPRNEKLQDGDLLTIDFVVRYKGVLADSAWTYAVGELSPEALELMSVTKEALYKGIEAARAGNRVGDIGAAIQSYTEGAGFSVVRDFAGHGIGPTIHEEPNIPHFGITGKGLRLKEGMAITIEPMINAGEWRSKMDENGWTARTKDGSLSAQFEHTLIVTKGRPIITTEQNQSAVNTN
ncbi:type I methionyl aminopeptidase [Salisediminibacterium halotolerans]|uniref:type I methionyl aminopeptidase n=1 Tax=Salisediminibacterium halotolerans TaxID=517425 RepID=UPI000EADE7FD|nr:type I methionyl aminopeptidase [Salisediminibacterium halotolerans]RLJ72365.1 methionine aminopeptidase type I [Actinophytocola xinjiangensis]RPE85580.1 methionine aminopeptidase type I [Salisediminibacterium halotolerans]TWG33534.1 methionine aminopeptidase type I [Salisediminibacterium halotolerans]GEL08733.1 methionine aminopeptidase [Salisediminibacterium halotolerans]